MPRLRLLPLLLLVPVVLAVGFAATGVAFAQDAVMPAMTPANQDAIPGYLLSASPILALVWGAFKLGQGVKVQVEVVVQPDTKLLLERLVDAAERVADHDGPPTHRLKLAAAKD